MMVKLEGGSSQIEIVKHLTRHDIPVCAHIGLKPQSVHKMGGYVVQDVLGRRLLIENLSQYLRFRHSTLSEGEFLAALVERYFRLLDRP